MTPTKHALYRWATRFPDMSLRRHYQRATLSLTPAELEWVRLRSVDGKHKQRLTQMGKQAFYRKTPCGIVFVIIPPDTIVTMFRLDRAAVWKVGKRLEKGRHDNART